MKKLLLIFVWSLPFWALSQERIILNWHTDFEEAQAISKETNKPILLYFTGSDWCPPCQKLKKDFFYTEKFKKRSQDFVLLIVDFPRNRALISQKQFKKNSTLLKKYNPENKFPNIVIVRHTGEKIDNLLSYNRKRGTSRHYKFLDRMLKKYSAK